MKIMNAKTPPKVYYGLHMVEGVAEYRQPDAEPYRIYIGEEAIKNMDPTFRGKPVYVGHVDKVDLENIQEEADGYVTRSFYNKADGKHWVEFIVVSDRGHEAISKGWKLSNAYVPKTMSNGGLWHGVEYAKEVKSGEYEHLAIVPNPRYEESVILTPEQFKTYNGEKELELSKLTNSKKEKGEGMLKFFKREKIENSADLENTVVALPKSGREMTISQLVNEMDKVVNMNGYANGDHVVKVGEEEMSVNELVEKYNSMCKKNSEAEAEKKQNQEDPEKKENEGEEEKKENEEAPKADEKKENEEAPKADDKKENEEEKKDEEKKQNAHYNALKNAQSTAIQNAPRVDLPEDRVKRGKSRYGSN